MLRSVGPLAWAVIGVVVVGLILWLVPWVATIVMGLATVVAAGAAAAFYLLATISVFTGARPKPKRYEQQVDKSWVKLSAANQVLKHGPVALVGIIFMLPFFHTEVPAVRTNLGRFGRCLLGMLVAMAGAVGSIALQGTGRPQRDRERERVAERPPSPAPEHRSAPTFRRREPPPVPAPAGPLQSVSRTYAVGQKIDILYGAPGWYAGEILAREGERYRVRYEGWGPEGDDTVLPNRLRPRE